MCAQAKILRENNIIENRVTMDMSICENCRKKLSREFSKLSEVEKNVKSEKTSPKSDSSFSPFYAAATIDAEMIQQLKKKFNESDTTREDQMKILSILQDSWSSPKIVDEFSVSLYTAKRVKDLVSKRGILFETEHKLGKSLKPDIVESVLEFYRSDSISRVCLGKKGYKTTVEGGEKRQTQRRLVLMNLNEAFEQYKVGHPTKKLSFSKFAELRPKECILAGQSSGIHVTCVCQQHQNVNLEFECVKRIRETNIDSLSTVMNKMLCDEKTEKCQLNECTACSDICFI